MKKTKTHVALSGILIIALFFCLHKGSAQGLTYKNNSIYGSYGSVINASQVSVSYERFVYKKAQFRTGVKLSYSWVSADGLDLETNERVYENAKGISGVVLFNMFEFNVGLAFTQYKLAQGLNPEMDVDYDELRNGVNFFGSTGLRFVLDEFMLKVGIGNLEYLYLGVGFNF